MPPPNEPTCLSKEVIGELLPHSGKFLLPDYVESFPEESRAIGYMQVPADADFTEGHFGILPGVLQVEFAFQTLAALQTPKNPELTGVALEIQDVQFGMMARVGDIITAEVQVTAEPEGRKGNLEATATVRKIGDSSKKSVMTLVGQVMPKKVFERMISPKQVANATDPMELLSPHVREAMAAQNE